MYEMVNPVTEWEVPGTYTRKRQLVSFHIPEGRGKDRGRTRTRQAVAIRRTTTRRAQRGDSGLDSAGEDPGR